MKRTLSLVLALVMILGTFTSVLAEPVDAEVEAGLLLEELGVLKGSLSGDLGLENALKREDAVVMLSRLMGEEDVAKDFPGVEEILTYEDLEEADPFYLPYLAWAYANKTFEGHSPVRFGYGEAMTGKQYLNVLLKVLGYDDVAWEDVMDKAVDVGLVEDAEEGEFVRGTMAVMTKVALETKMNDSEVTLAESLDIEMPAPPAPEALEVEEVVADNLKEVKVVFNQEVDKDTVTDSNVAVKGLDGTAALLEDGVTVVVTMEAALTNQKEYTLIADKVVAANGAEMEKAEVKFTAFDATLPEVLSVEVTGPRNLTVTFSEPMAKEGTLTIKQDKVNLGSTVELSGNKASVRAYTNFVEGKEYSVTVTGFEDYAEYKNVVNTLTFTYEKDENPPVATVEKAEQTYVIVSFDKPVKGLNKDKFYHTFTAWTAEKLVDMNDDPVVATKSYNKVKVYFIDGDDGRAIPAGETVFGILGKDIKDNWGNALGNYESTIYTTADRTLPEVKEIKVKTERMLEVEFTKDVTFASKNVDILDADGKKISGVYVTVGGSGSKYTIDFGKKLAGKIITVTIKDVEDTSLYNNVLSLYTEVIEVTDKTKPAVDHVYYSNIEQDEKDEDVYIGSLYVVFDESVDADTALVDTNYSLIYGDEDITILKDANTSFDVVNNRVKISLTSDQAEELFDSNDKKAVKMLVINVKDLAGNTISPIQTNLESLEDTNTVSYTVKATKTNQLVVEFKDLLSNVKLANFTIGEDNYGEGFTLTQEDSSTKTTLTFDLDKDETKFATDATGIVFGIDKDHEIKNSYGEDAEFTTDGLITDKIKPGIALNNDDEKEITVTAGTYDQITIAFTEKMDAGTFSKLSFGVEGKTVEDIAWDDSDNPKTLTITLTDEIEVGDNVRLLYVNDVKDAVGNDLNHDKGVVVEIKVK